MKALVQKCMVSTSARMSSGERRDAFVYFTVSSSEELGEN